MKRLKTIDKKVISKMLKRNPPQVPENNKRTDTLYQDYSHCIANFCVTVLNIFLNEIISNNAKCR